VSNRIDLRNGSQLGQDEIVLQYCSHKRDGTFLDVGCGWPKVISNTWLLETRYGWRGVGIDTDIDRDAWTAERPKTKLIQADATQLTEDIWLELCQPLFGADSNRIDYLSLDIEPPLDTLMVLATFPKQRVRFNVITFETDEYRDGEAGQARARLAKTILESHGYSLRAQLYPSLPDLICDSRGPQEQVWVSADVLSEYCKGNS
jgi:hypothetical protein